MEVSVSSMGKYARTLLGLLVVLAIAALVIGFKAPPASEPAPAAPGSDAGSGPSVTCLALGLYGDITAPPVMEWLSDSRGDLTFVGTSNGLYVVDPRGQLSHFLYSPFGIEDFAVIDDITGDGVRDVVVALNDTQVPALRCHDGATWEKLWQFAPMARVWDRQWVDRQLAVTGLEVMAGEEGQSLVVTSGRCAFSVDARDGSEQWRFSASSALGPMVALDGLGGDSSGVVLVGSDEGDLFRLSGRTGEVQWQTRLPKHKGVTYEGIQRLVSSMAVLDEEAGKVVVASADGYAQMYDLLERRLEWETRAFGSDPGSMGPDYSAVDLLISLAPDVSGDGLPEVLLSGSPQGNAPGYAAYAYGKATLCDSAGNVLWEKSSLAYSAMGVETGTVDGKPFFLESAGGEIKLTDLKDGKSVLRTVPLDELASADQAIITRQPGGTGYQAFSTTSDLTLLSDTGEVLWSCPRLATLTAQEGGFVGDSASDVLFCAERIDPTSGGYVYDTKLPDGAIIRETSPGLAAQKPGVRLLAMMDGATRAFAWSYEVPYGDLRDSGGLQGIMVGPDLAGNDGIPDIVGYRGDTVFIFSGRNGSLATVPVGVPISKLEVVGRGGAGSALALSTSGSGGLESGGGGGLLIIDPGGTPLWTTTAAEWLGNETGGSFTVLDDINSDTISDLALVSAARMVVFQSAAATDNYEEHLTVEAKAGYNISRVEQVPDADRDGIRDLACIQQPGQETAQFTSPTAPLLSVRSASDGEKLFEVGLPEYRMADDLACGDFNGDGCADSLFVSTSDKGLGMRLLVLSGKDGSTLRDHLIEMAYYGGSQTGASPAANIGDFDGDGADDLVYASAPGGEYEYLPDGGSVFTPFEQAHLSLCVWSPARDEVLMSVPATPSLNAGYYEGDTRTPLTGDVDGDGHLEVVCGVAEPDVPSFDPDAYSGFYSNGVHGGNLAVVDFESGQRLAGFAGFNVSTMSVFQPHDPGSLGVAASGAVFFLLLDSPLEVTSPGNGARTGPSVEVAWEGPAVGDFSLVLVDGLRNDMTNGLRSDLYLGRGVHDITVRSVDDWGRISYGPSDLEAPLTITVAPSPWRPVWLVLTLLALAAIALALFYPRLHRAWRARRRAAK